MQNFMTEETWASLTHVSQNAPGRELQTSQFDLYGGTPDKIQCFVRQFGSEPRLSVDEDSDTKMGGSGAEF